MEQLFIEGIVRIDERAEHPGMIGAHFPDHARGDAGPSQSLLEEKCARARTRIVVRTASDLGRRRTGVNVQAGRDASARLRRLAIDMPVHPLPGVGLTGEIA